MNTWLWSLQGDPHFERFGKIFGGAFGRPFCWPLFAALQKLAADNLGGLGPLNEISILSLGGDGRPT